MKKIIFLDIDGVLWPDDSDTKSERDNFDPVKVDNLNYILNSDPSIFIVISSSWRIDKSLLQLKDVFADHGVDPERLVGVTPYLPKERGHEIQSWLTEHHGKVQSFVIIDDDSDMVHLTPFLFKTYFGSGLTRKIAEDVVKFLVNAKDLTAI